MTQAIAPTTTDRVEHARSVMTSAKSHEHYTPQDILNAVYLCLGGVELDPCSNGYGDEANVKADHHFTKADDALKQQWKARSLFMNPPYSSPKLAADGSVMLNSKGQPIMTSVMGLWVDKLIAEYQSGNVEEAIALVKGDTSTQWHRKLRDFPKCEYAGRVQFIGNNAPATFCTHLFYLGTNEQFFYHCFSPLGDIWRRVQYSK